MASILILSASSLVLAVDAWEDVVGDVDGEVMERPADDRVLM